MTTRFLRSPNRPTAASEAVGSSPESAEKWRLRKAPELPPDRGLGLATPRLEVPWMDQIRFASTGIGGLSASIHRLICGKCELCEMDVLHTVSTFDL